MSDVRNVIIGNELNYHKYHKDNTELDYPLLGTFLHIDNVRRDITDDERNDECNCRSQNSKEHIQKECSNIRLIVTYKLLQIL